MLNGKKARGRIPVVGRQVLPLGIVKINTPGGIGRSFLSAQSGLPGKTHMMRIGIAITQVVVTHHLNNRRNALPPAPADGSAFLRRSEEHTSELQSRPHLVCRLLLE